MVLGRQKWAKTWSTALCQCQIVIMELQFWTLFYNFDNIKEGYCNIPFCDDIEQTTTTQKTINTRRTPWSAPKPTSRSTTTTTTTTTTATTTTTTTTTTKTTTTERTTKQRYTTPWKQIRNSGSCSGRGSVKTCGRLPETSCRCVGNRSGPGCKCLILK